MNIKIKQKNTSLDVRTVMDMWYKVETHEDSCSSWKYNPKCPMVKEKEKAYKRWNKIYDAPESEEKEKVREGYFGLPQGKVLHVEYWFPKKDFAELSNWLIRFEIPFEVMNYNQSELEQMQDEIDCSEKGDKYSEVYDKYEKLYRSEPEEKEQNA
tara:strand:+ start:875 stop:1339 length:465 start_codon:yes stop_codon:yes gene_type:complete